MYIYTILGILGSCHVLQEAVFGVFGARSHGNTAQVIRTSFGTNDPRLSFAEAGAMRCESVIPLGPC